MSSDATVAATSSTSTSTLRIRIRRQRHHSRASNPNPNPNRPHISIDGPFAPNSTQAPLHTSDYIDSDDEDLFNSILHRIANEQHQTTTRLSRTSKSFIDSIPIVKITGSISCSICKDEFVIDERASRLPCNHVFHHECIVPWLNRSNSCPLCRYKLPVERRPEQLNRCVVREGDSYVEGWGEDRQSALHDALLRSSFGLIRLPSPSPASSLSSTRMGRAQANTEETVSGSLVEREVHVDAATSGIANGVVNVMLDEDGDTVMPDI